MIHQIVRFTRINTATRIIERRFSDFISEKIQLYCERLKSKKVKKCYESKNIKAVYLGKTVAAGVQLPDLNNISGEKNLYFKRMVKDSCLYTSCEITNPRSCNCYAQLNDKSFIQIVKFVVNTESLEEITVCKKMEVSALKDCSSIFKVTKINEDNTLIDTASISRVCVFLSVNRKNYIIAVPHLYYY